MRPLRSQILFLAIVLFAGALHAAPTCPVIPAGPRANQLQNWYDTYLRPFRTLVGVTEGDLKNPQIEALIEKVETYSQRAARDPLFFEPLVQQIIQRYARAFDFSGLDSALAQKSYRPGSGPDIDFSLTCIDSRTTKAPDDTFAITLFGVRQRDCQHVGLRGLVFTETLVNGAANGVCRPDHFYYRSLFVTIPAGTNTVTFACRKDESGCLRQ